MGTVSKKKELNLGEAKISRLLLTFAIPSILSHLVASIYNIVDQIFIGQVLGTSGNAASQAAYMFVLLMTAFYVFIACGTASRFSLMQGQGASKKKLGQVIGNGFFLLIAVGIVLAVVTVLARSPLLNLFGAKNGTIAHDYAMTYTWIIAIGMPFQMFGAGGAIIIRADKSPNYSMFVTLSGAIINIGLDALFMYPLDMGIAGAALATIIGQVFSAGMCAAYFFRFKSIRFRFKYFRPRWDAMKEIMKLGLSAGLMQLAIMIVSTVINNQLSKYGGTSLIEGFTGEVPAEYIEAHTVEGIIDYEAAMAEYGSATAIAVAGVVSKVDSIFNAIIVGIAQSCQPVFGYNYGAKKYKRVRNSFLYVVGVAFCVGVVATILFQTIPVPILHIFKSGTDELYDHFGTQYLRIYMAAVSVVSIPISVSNFFPSLGMPKRGIVASIARQVFFQLPLIYLLPLALGMNGILYAGFIADSCAAITTAAIVIPLLVKLGHMPDEATPGQSPAAPEYAETQDAGGTEDGPFTEPAPEDVTL
ncbi:MAG: MATE family efflux transporter [Clostridia bacterium]|nr:MATE family efflux transporter [Clostridia bacterium]